MKKREDLIKQAKRVGIKIGGYYGWKESEITRDIVASRIRRDRNKFRSFLEYKYLPTLKEFVDAYNKENAKFQITYFEAFKDPYELLSDYDTDDNYDHHRWCSYFDATKIVNDKIFSYQWANANGDNSLEDAGFDVYDVWSTMSVVDPSENVFMYTEEEVYALVDDIARDIVVNRMIINDDSVLKEWFNKRKKKK